VRPIRKSRFRAFASAEFKSKRRMWLKLAEAEARGDRMGERRLVEGGEVENPAGHYAASVITARWAQRARPLSLERRHR
jgi:hypothetical protein